VLFQPPEILSTIDTVAYHGEMDTKARDVSYRRWKSEEVKIMVATTFKVKF